MSEQLFELVTVERTPDGRCSVCGSSLKEGVREGETECLLGHVIGGIYRRPKYGYGAPLTRMVVAGANGNVCLLCGGQVDETGICGSGLGHVMGQMYVMSRANTPSLFT